MLNFPIERENHQKMGALLGIKQILDRQKVEFIHVILFNTL